MLHRNFGNESQNFGILLLMLVLRLKSSCWVHRQWVSCPSEYHCCTEIHWVSVDLCFTCSMIDTVFLRSSLFCLDHRLVVSLFLSFQKSPKVKSCQIHSLRMVGSNNTHGGSPKPFTFNQCVSRDLVAKHSIKEYHMLGLGSSLAL